MTRGILVGSRRGRSASEVFRLKTSLLISVVIPVHCEEASLGTLIAALRDTFRPLSYDYEFIVVDDGSNDGTWETLQGLVRECTELSALRLGRRFGKEAALAAGLERARGEAVIVMDGDLQHPPSLLVSMLETWNEGDVAVVEAVKQTRRVDGALERWSASLFYALISWLSGTDLRRSTDFKLLDRRVVDRWCEMGERNLFFRGMVRWLGFESVQIPFTVPERVAGDSNWSFVSRLRLALTAITSFSSFPLRLLTIAGSVLLLLSILLGLQTLGRWLAGEALSGFTTVILLNLILGGAVIVALGVIGEYVARIYEEVKGRPRFVTTEVVGQIEGRLQSKGERRDAASERDKSVD